MSDPTFTTRADLEEWVARTGRKAVAHQVLGERTALLEATVHIRRVTLAHAHLLADQPQ